MKEIAIILTETATAKWPTKLSDMEQVSLYNVPGPTKGNFDWPPSLIVEIRSEGKITDHATRSWCCVSQATMTLRQAKELRAALDNWIAVQKKPEPWTEQEKVRTAELLDRVLEKGENKP